MLAHLASILGMKDIPQSWERNVNDAVACLPPDIPFLNEQYLEDVRKQINLSEANAQWIRETMASIRQDEHLRMLAWLWHYVLYRKPDFAGENLSSWPLPAHPADDRTKRMEGFPVVILLSRFERLEALYKERNIPDEVTRDTLSAVETCIELYKLRTGIHGLGISYFQWLQHHFNGRLYKIGRLEYEMRTFINPVRVYRHVQDGSITALSVNDIKYRGDGLVDGTNGISDAINGWTATYEETESEITGYPIHPDGYALNEPVTLLKRQWQLALSPGDPVISIHIPRHGPFTYEACRDSLIQAYTFFTDYYADRPFAAFTCISWLMDPQLRQLLDESSNLVQFQHWYRLYPVKSGDEALFSFVFMCERCEVDELPEKTSLQRKIKQFMQGGGRMHAAGGFILPQYFETLA